MIHATISLDGFVAGPEDDLEWVFRYGTDSMADAVVEGLGAVVLGKRTFDISVREGRMPYGGLLKIPQFVVTHEEREQESVKGLRFVFVNGGVARAVGLAKEAAAARDVSVLGASVARQCLKEGLADEMVLHIAPLLLGRGIRLFDGLEDTPIHLKKVAVVSSAEVTSIRLRVLR